MMDGKRLLDTCDVARRVDSSPRTVQRWARDGRISGTCHVGRQFRFEAKSVEAQMDTGCFPRPCTGYAL